MVTVQDKMLNMNTHNMICILRYTYVDPRVVGVLGYLPQDLIGQVSYEYYHPDDIQKMVQLHHDGRLP